MEATSFESKADAEEDRNKTLEEDAIRLIIERVCDKKADLYWYFTQHDADASGECTRLQWATALRTVLNIDLPFLHVQNKLCETEPDSNRLNYARFLERYRIQMRQADQGWMTSIIQRVCEKLFKSCSSLEEAFRVFDVNDDGSIEYAEFVQTLRNLNIGLTDEQIYELMRTIDDDQNSLIDMKEFSLRFRISFDRVRLQAASTQNDEGKEGKGGSQKRSSDSGASKTPTRRRRNSSIDVDIWAQTQLLEIGKRMFSLENTLENAFRRFDTDNSGELDRDKFSKALEVIGMNFDAEKAARLFSAVDADSSDSIQWTEFVSAFQIDDTVTSSSSSERATWQDSVVQQVANSLFQHRVQMLSAFRMFDIDNSGEISAREFRVGLRAVNKLLPQALSNVQIDELRRALDKNGDGSIDYKEFLEGLRVSLIFVFACLLTMFLFLPLHAMADLTFLAPPRKIISQIVDTQAK
eukprot:g1214.t1